MTLLLGDPPSRTRMAGCSRGAPTLGRGLHKRLTKEEGDGVSLIPILQIEVGNEASNIDYA